MICVMIDKHVDETQAIKDSWVYKLLKTHKKKEKQTFC